MSGKMKSSKRQAAELHFDFPVESLGKLSRRETHQDSNCIMPCLDRKGLRYTA